MINKSALVKRYSDAYSIARITSKIGKLIQIVGLVLAVGVGGISALIGLSLGGISGEAIGVLLMAALGGIVGLVPGALISLIGVLLSANGQMLLAILDGTVSSSPFLEDEDKVGMMHLQTQQAQPVNYPAFTPPPPVSARNQADGDAVVRSSDLPATPQKVLSDEEITQTITEECMRSFGINEDRMRDTFEEIRIPQGNIESFLDSLEDESGFYIPPYDRGSIRRPIDIITIILKRKK